LLKKDRSSKDYPMSKIVVGVMGPGHSATPEALADAFELGKLIAEAGWLLLTGGRSAGVMETASQGARSAGGLVIGVLATDDVAGMSDCVDIPIVTGMGQARNNINILSSRVIFACGMGPGTASEVALSLKAGKPVILLDQTAESVAFFKSLGGKLVHFPESPKAAIELAKHVGF
jgi:uncharacterized protein (TIGR00725 family)